MNHGCFSIRVMLTLNAYSKGKVSANFIAIACNFLDINVMILPKRNARVHFVTLRGAGMAQW